MSNYYVDVDIVLKTGEGLRNAQGHTALQGPIRDELAAAGLTSKVLDTSGEYPHVRLYGTRRKLEEYLKAQGHEDAEVQRYDGTRP